MSNTENIISKLDLFEKEYRDAGNQDNFSEISNDSRKKLTFRCNRCKYEYETTKFDKIIRKKGGCTYCTGQKTFPHLTVDFLFENTNEFFSLPLALFLFLKRTFQKN